MDPTSTSRHSSVTDYEASSARLGDYSRCLSLPPQLPARQRLRRNLPLGYHTVPHATAVHGSEVRCLEGLFGGNPAAGGRAA